MLINQEQLVDPVGALISLKERVYDHERFSLEEYLEDLPQNLWKFQALSLDIQGETLEERCESCLKQLIHHGLIRIN